MKCDPKIHHRRSIRLQGYDYSHAGAYFVTICTQNRACLFGDVVNGVNGEMALNDAGQMAEECWRDIPVHFPHTQLDKFVVMPNHIHGIVVINALDEKIVGAKNFSPLQSPAPSATRLSGTTKTIGSIVRGFKIGVTKWMRQNTPIYNVWQRNYHEHIVRNENELNRIRRYIIDNPAKWELDRENPAMHTRAVRETASEYGGESWMI